MRRRTACTRRHLASMAWERARRRMADGEWRMKATASVSGDVDGDAVSPRDTTSPRRAHRRGLDGVGEERKAERRTTTTPEVTTTTGAGTCWVRGHGKTRGAHSDDNYRGRDDNYPREVKESGTGGRVEGPGDDRQK